MKDYRDLLKEEFEIRSLANKSYSKRSFAKELGVSSGQLSDILNYKKGLSKEKALSIADILGLNTKETQLFLTLVESEHTRKKSERLKAQKFLETKTKYNKLDEGVYKLISDWHYFAIMATMQLEDFNGTSLFIADKLNLELATVDEAIQNLISLHLVREEKGELIPMESYLETETDFVSVARRKSHKQTIMKAFESIDTINVVERDITAITMAIDSTKIPEAKRKIAKFRKELADYLEDGVKDSVYNLNLQLFPLSNTGDRA